MNGKGPEKNGLQTGRKLGNCVPDKEKNLNLLGKGLGKRRKAGGGEGLGKRLNSDNKK